MTFRTTTIRPVHLARDCPTCPKGSGSPAVTAIQANSPQVFDWGGEELRQTKVALLEHGYVGNAYKLMEGLGQDVVFVKIPFSASDLLAKAPILVIPSGGLYGQENSEAFKAALGEYVHLGGTVICFDLTP